MAYKLRWTEEAVKSLDRNVDYLSSEWSKSVITKFKASLNKLLSLIQINPFLFPTSKHNKTLRRAVLNKRISIVYKVDKNHIFIVNILSNSMKTNT